MKMEMSIKLICQLFAVVFLLLWSKKVEVFFFSARELKEQVPERPQGRPRSSKGQCPSGQEVWVKHHLGGGSGAGDLLVDLLHSSGSSRVPSSGYIEHRVYCFRLSWTRFLLSVGFMAFTANECLFLNYKKTHLSAIPRCPSRTPAS